MRKPIRHASVLVAAVLIATSLTGCGLGTQVPDTAKMRGVGNGVDVKSGDLLAQDVTVVTTGATVGISATVINNGAAASVTGVSVDGKPLTLVFNGTPAQLLPVVAGGATRLGFQSNESAIGAYAVPAGGYADVVITFADGSILTANALVVNKSGMYADVVTELPAAPVA